MKIFWKIKSSVSNDKFSVNRSFSRPEISPKIFDYRKPVFRDENSGTSEIHWFQRTKCRRNYQEFESGSNHRAKKSKMWSRRISILWNNMLQKSMSKFKSRRGPKFMFHCRMNHRSLVVPPCIDDHLVWTIRYGDC